ncbi:hypothetical protein K2D_09280 [Enterococcus hirae]|nr:hypothetical protein K2D_09280 [Enterococcus hirae]
MSGKCVIVLVWEGRERSFTRGMNESRVTEWTVYERNRYHGCLV